MGYSALHPSFLVVGFAKVLPVVPLQAALRLAVLPVALLVPCQVRHYLSSAVAKSSLRNVCSLDDRYLAPI